jgi:hypothetical protein
MFTIIVDYGEIASIAMTINAVSGTNEKRNVNMKKLICEKKKRRKI